MVEMEGRELQAGDQEIPIQMQARVTVVMAAEPETVEREFGKRYSLCTSWFSVSLDLGEREYRIHQHLLSTEPAFQVVTAEKVAQVAKGAMVSRARRRLDFVKAMETVIRGQAEAETLATRAEEETAGREHKGALAAMFSS